MTMNPLIIELMVKERSAEIQGEVQRLHLIAQYDAHRSAIASRSSVWGRLWIALGDLLIRFGERLKSRYGPHEETPTGEGPHRFYSCP
jgi:hypothetical protein